MTINKSQGQTLKIAGIDVREYCFSHGQFYVACFKVSMPTNLVIMAPTGKTLNVIVIQYYFLLYTYKNYIILDFERSDECIDFKMMCVFFFLCLSPLDPVSDRKVNILDALYRSKVNIFQQFSKKSRKTKKNDVKREFLRKTSFRPNRFFMVLNLTFFELFIDH
ncbi:piggyBac transposable element-derived protein 4-like [Aphis craccivora]|uniref:PiggyBac transposable element-derived protein 4-like n=1 Tax=Aphis craccivora TaxID=307492 RepID=A0A6G0YAX3_APHCR|nr:piggyBac transposable element-derived protein 4-like [Aphis craccivora]